MFQLPSIGLNACIKRGFVKLDFNKYLFHNLKSDTLANLLNIPGNLVPVPLLFKQYGTEQAHLPLFKPNEPSLSIVRLLLSAHPYALNSSLIIGHQHMSGRVTVFQSPMITYADFEETPIKLEATLMMCKDETMEGAVEVEISALASLDAVQKKHVVIQENKNVVRIYEPCKALKKKRGLNASLSSPLKPILVMSAESIQHVHQTEMQYLARLYFTMVKEALKVGTCSMSAFNTIVILSRSQNTINLLPTLDMTDVQRLFVKHVILHKMGLENSLLEFKELYTPVLVDVTDTHIDQFESIIIKSKQVAENIIFCLNSIGEATFPKPVQVTAPVNLALAMEKYFLMFTPHDKENAVAFAASIVDILCKGSNLEKVVKYLEKYMEIKEFIARDNLIKTYALFTI